MTEIVNMGDVIATVFVLGFMVIVPAIIIIVISKNKKRANETHSAERDNTLLLTKQLDDLNERVNALEKMLEK